MRFSICKINEYTANVCQIPDFEKKLKIILATTPPEIVRQEDLVLLQVLIYFLPKLRVCI